MGRVDEEALRRLEAAVETTQCPVDVAHQTKHLSGQAPLFHQGATCVEIDPVETPGQIAEGPQSQACDKRDANQGNGDEDQRRHADGKVPQQHGHTILGHRNAAGKNRGLTGLCIETLHAGDTQRIIQVTMELDTSERPQEWHVVGNFPGRRAVCKDNIFSKVCHEPQVRRVLHNLFKFGRRHQMDPAIRLETDRVCDFLRQPDGRDRHIGLETRKEIENQAERGDDRAELQDNKTKSKSPAKGCAGHPISAHEGSSLCHECS